MIFEETSLTFVYESYPHPASWRCSLNHLLLKKYVLNHSMWIKVNTEKTWGINGPIKGVPGTVLPTTKKSVRASLFILIIRSGHFHKLC